MQGEIFSAKVYTILKLFLLLKLINENSILNHPTESPSNRFALRQGPPLALLARGEDGYPHLLLVLGLMEKIMDGTWIEQIVKK